VTARPRSPCCTAAESPSLHWLDAPAPPAIVRLALAGRAGAAGGYGAYLQVMAHRPRGDDPLAFETWVMQVLTTFDRFRLLCACARATGAPPA